MFSTGYRLIQWIGYPPLDNWGLNFNFSCRSVVNSQVLPRSIFPFERISDGARGKREVLSFVARVRHAIPKPRSKGPL